jgi:ParB-like chromosome segregation protein Spo0J
MADTAVKKASKRPLKRAVKQKDRFLFENTRKVPINSLKPHPDNPNEGDIESIAESLSVNGMYKPIVVNSRNGLIVAGHHTWLAARSLGWPEVGVIEIDVDEDEHMRIMLVDNATSDLRRYNEELRAKILSKLKDVKGTGISRGEADEIINRNRARVSEAVEAIEGRLEEEREAIEDAKSAKSFERVPLGEETAAGSIGDDEDEVSDEPEVPGRLEKAADDLKGAFQLKPDLAFGKDDAVGVWQIPRIRSDMLMTWDELPENLLAWAGSATKDWPEEDQWWLYNFGTDSTSGMRDPSKIIVAFYAFDHYFENWWFYPDKYVTKVLNTGIKYMVMPDFSMHTPGEESRVLSLWNLYRNRWLARYFQEAGLKVIPNVTWATKDEEFLTRHIIPTLPKDIPLLALQIQTVDEKSPDHKDYVRQLQYILDKVKPEGLLLYHGAQGKRIFDNKEVKYSGKIKFIASRQTALGEKAKLRKKKKTL